MVKKLDLDYVFDAKAIVRMPEALVMARVHGILRADDFKTFAYLANRTLDFTIQQRIPVQDLIAFLGPGTDVRSINESLSRLGDTPIEAMFCRNSYDSEVLTPMYFLDSDASRAMAGILFFRFPQDIAKMLASPTRYGRLHLDVLRQLDTLAGVRLYMVMCSQMHRTRHGRWTVPLKNDP